MKGPFRNSSPEFQNQFPAHFATETSPRCSSLQVHISSIHCCNPNAGLVRQKAGKEALVVFIGSPVTADPVLDIAWHQNHEERRPF